MKKSTEIFNQIKEVFTEMDGYNDKAQTGNKSASGKMRKCSLVIDKLCKEFRKASVADCKN